MSTTTEGLAQIREALELCVELAQAVAARVHDCPAGYRPETHAAADKDIATANAALYAFAVLEEQLAQRDAK